MVRLINPWDEALATWGPAATAMCILLLGGEVARILVLDGDSSVLWKLWLLMLPRLEGETCAPTSPAWRAERSGESGQALIYSTLVIQVCMTAYSRVDDGENARGDAGRPGAERNLTAAATPTCIPPIQGRD